MKQYFLYIVAILLISGCSKNQSTYNVEKQLEEIKKQLDLVTVEVVKLNKKLSKLNKNEAPELKKPSDIKYSFRESPTIGSEQAKIAMIEFMDYQCPYCIRHANKVFPDIKRRYVDTGLMQYQVRSFPLDFHEQAKPAGKSAICAHGQGKFQEMHSALISNTKSLSSSTYNKLAVQVELDLEVFENCINSQTTNQLMEKDIAYGIELGVRGTPRFYIGNIKGTQLVNVIVISGAASKETFEKAIDSLIRN